MGGSKMRNKRSPVENRALAELPKLEKHFSEFSQMIYDFSGIRLHARDVKKLVENLLIDDKEYWVAEFKDLSFRDTAPRDIAINRLSKIFIGQQWPINRDAEETKMEFLLKLDQVSQKRRWSLSLGTQDRIRVAKIWEMEK